MIEATLAIIFIALIVERFMVQKAHTQTIQHVLEEAAQERKTLTTALIAKSAADLSMAQAIDTSKLETETPPPDFAELDPNDPDAFDEAIEDATQFPPQTG